MATILFSLTVNQEFAEIMGHYFHSGGIRWQSVCKSFSVSDFVASAKFAAEDITKRGRIPVLVGGTGLYADSFLKGMNFEENATAIERHQQIGGHRA